MQFEHLLAIFGFQSRTLFSTKARNYENAKVGFYFPAFLFSCFRGILNAD
jgi:hypothetical protein